MKTIFNLARDILEKQKIQSSVDYSVIIERINYLRINSVEFSGVGMYINFKEVNTRNKNYLTKGYLGGEGRLKFDTCGAIFDYVVSYNNGYIDMIEIVTPENIDWDGGFQSYELLDN